MNESSNSSSSSSILLSYISYTVSETKHFISYAERHRFLRQIDSSSGLLSCLHCVAVPHNFPVYWFRRLKLQPLFPKVLRPPGVFLAIIFLPQGVCFVLHSSSCLQCLAISCRYSKIQLAAAGVLLLLVLHLYYPSFEYNLQLC